MSASKTLRRYEPTKTFKADHTQNEKALSQGCTDHFNNVFSRVLAGCYLSTVSNSDHLFNHAQPDQQLLSSCFPPLILNSDL